ncbi:MAG: hypothetical protein ACOX64_09080 [Candidatus Merdivicinus sp.]|jgi:2,4-dienoyl-CoA reductase-like NADH-dependent reductase (Old Yellow Enzyme family)
MTAMFEPYQLPHLRLKNRIVRSATHDYVENPDGTVSEAQFAIYSTLAENQIGLIFTGHMYIHPSGQAGPLQNGICEQRFLPALRELTNRVHARGGVIAAQINHAGAKAISPDRRGPSPLTLLGGCPAREMTFEEITEVRDQFIEAAALAKEAGFDGVQVHTAHHYLLSQFLTPSMNLRTDRYGGSPENRFRLCAEIIAGIKERCGADYPVFVKLNSNVPTGDAAYEEELLSGLLRFRELGVEAAELSGYDVTARRNERAYYLDRAVRLRKASGLPIILVGGIRSTVDLERLDRSGIALAAMSRPLICEPDLIPKMLAGQVTSHCLSCNQCFTLPQREGIRCVLHQKRPE